jgi:acyl carrier protein
MDIQSWLVNWFAENAFIDREVIANNLNSNYFETGWIDSMKFITLLSDIEAEFNCEFMGDDFDNRAFSTLAGLVKIIRAKLA